MSSDLISDYKPASLPLPFAKCAVDCSAQNTCLSISMGALPLEWLGL